MAGWPVAVLASSCDHHARRMPACQVGSQNNDLQCRDLAYHRAIRLDSQRVTVDLDHGTDDRLIRDAHGLDLAASRTIAVPVAITPGVGDPWDRPRNRVANAGCRRHVTIMHVEC